MAYLMIVDDDLDFAGALGTFLESQGYEVVVEPDPQKASGRIEQRRPDAVILDVMFPESDTAGFELARSLREAFGPLPVLMLTSINHRFPLGFGARDADSPALPAVDFLGKPVDFHQLAVKVANILKSSVAD